MVDILVRTGDSTTSDGWASTTGGIFGVIKEIQAKAVYITTLEEPQTELERTKEQLRIAKEEIARLRKQLFLSRKR